MGKTDKILRGTRILQSLGGRPRVALRVLSSIRFVLTFLGDKRCGHRRRLIFRRRDAYIC
jgi:hypothetical protein